ncbi:hypothetical protein P7B02_16860 [Caulobacter segnis]|uniref:hypothetical protein n=1 Tax=Caulobacter segnis TaxID=88688 RepID=UPI00240EE7F2|nr:hypothetical protein [Caulobacter segnis]MDG2523203.1 hypothetical protein [Caulobacter segnis]
MNCAWNPAARRYTLRMAIAMAAYVGVLVASLTLLRTRDLQGPLLWLTAVAPAIPIMGVIAAMGAYVTEMADEYQRVKLVRAMIIATGLSLSIFTALGFLENAGAIGKLEGIWAFPVWCACLGLAQAVGAVRDR